MGSSTIDYVAIPEGLRNSLINCEVLQEDELNTSDHYAICTVLNLGCIPRMVASPRPVGRVKWDKPNVIAKYQELVSRNSYDLRVSFNSSPKSPESIDECINQMVHNLTTASNELPRSRFRKNVRPFWNLHLTELKRAKVECHKLWKEAKRPRGENPLYLNHKQAKKNFMRELRRVQKDYERNEIDGIIRDAHSNKNRFWRKIKKSRQSGQNDVYAIRQPSGEVVYDIDSVVNVWRDHFEKISLPRESPKFDLEHFENVTQQVKIWSENRSNDEFLRDDFSNEEIRKGLKVLKKRKAAGCDGLTTEHLIHAGDNTIYLLSLLYNSILETEYVPDNFRRGTQIPLYKGKNLCPLDVNNYRGITLLTCMNKLFEVIIWERIKDWWDEAGVISPLQGACRKGSSCLHSAYILQESIATGLDTKRKVFVAYFDAAKAFDSVWTDGLFYQLRRAGLNGKTWRILYKCYENFRCKVRLADTYSDWYTMKCGIHQGGFLSLLKYAAFIDPLLREIETSGFVSRIINIPASPVGYADDLSLCSLSKFNMDQVLKIVYKYSCKWRFYYNASKSAVMTYGENKREASRNSKFRNFQLGTEKVKERIEYDHVGIKNCLFSDTTPRTEDRISRGRRAFNAIASIGIKKDGVCFNVCSNVYWAIIVPIVSYGSELWVLQPDENELLSKFQRYVSRRCQRFPKRSPNFSAVSPLGWIDILKFIKVKKMLFLRTILVMQDNSVCKQIFNARSETYFNNLEEGRRNVHSCPTFEILNTCADFGMLDVCRYMIENGCHLSKSEWCKNVWSIAWEMEDAEYSITHKDSILHRVSDKPRCITWWVLSDLVPSMVGICESMAKLVCDASLLKANDYRLKKLSHSHKICTACDQWVKEDIWHIVMQCPYYEGTRSEMRDVLNAIDDPEVQRVISEPQEFFNVVMGKHPENTPFESMIKLWAITGRYITRMYKHVINNR